MKSKFAALEIINTSSMINCKSSLFLLLILFIGGCKSKSIDTVEVAEEKDIAGNASDAANVTINIEDAKSLVKSFKDIVTVEFEENAENIIGMPQNLVVRGDTLFAIDTYKAPGVYAYNRNGEQLFSYCAVGDGPEEFYDLSDLTVDDISISAYDRTNGRIIDIDKKGNFVRKRDVPSQVFGAVIDQDGDYWIDFSNQADGGGKLAWRPDSAINFVAVLPVPEVLKGMVNVPLQQFHRLYDGELTYMPSFEHKIYTLRSGEAKLKYNLDFKGLWPADDEMGKWKGNNWAIKMRDFPVTRLICQENDKWLIVGFYNDGKLYIHIIDKVSSEGNTYECVKDAYYIPLEVYGDELFMLRSDGNLDILNLKDFS